MLYSNQQKNTLGTKSPEQEHYEIINEEVQNFGK